MKAILPAAIAFVLVLDAQGFAADGSAARGQRVFGVCAACHSLQPDQNMTGPSLADLWGRKAGTLPSFDRYSPLSNQQTSSGTTRRWTSGSKTRSIW